MATAYDPITAAGNGQHQQAREAEGEDTAGLAEGIAVRRFHPSGAASPAATVERDEGVKMHSWLTMNAPWARMIAPETVTVVPQRPGWPRSVTAIQPAMPSTAAFSENSGAVAKYHAP